MFLSDASGSPIFRWDSVWLTQLCRKGAAVTAWVGSAGLCSLPEVCSRLRLWSLWGLFCLSVFLKKLIYFWLRWVSVAASGFL